MNPQNYHVDFIRVSRQKPCPVCDHDHWCYFIWDMTAVVCMRKPSDHLTRCGEGWIHHLKLPRHQPADMSPTFKLSSDPVAYDVQAGPDLASPQARDKVYRCLFSHLSLSRSHRSNLLRRGLTQSEILSLGYVSLPDGLERLPFINRLTDLYGQQLLTIPGFYLTAKKRIWLAGPAGMLIPCKDVDGNIVGAQIRTENTSGGGKYRWLSASPKQRKRRGVSSGTPIHVSQFRISACGPGVPRNPKSEIKRVWITEGILKADVAARKLGKIVLGVAGVSSWREAELKPILDTLDTRSVVVAFDADTQTNAHVRSAKARLYEALLGMDYRVAVAAWDIEHGKGIDDLLIGGHYPILAHDGLGI